MSTTVFLLDVRCKSLILFALLLVGAKLNAQCPTLTGGALTSPDCAAGFPVCTLCPGDSFTLTVNGTGLTPGDCVNWYYGTTNNFNPYNGEGTLLGCAPITAVPPNSCSPCPTFFGMLVDACGTEENNEYLALYSGGGFYVDDLSVDFDAMNNGGGGNDDIGTGCGFQEPSPDLIAYIQNNCPNSVIVGAGPGEVVPPGVPVLVFTSAAMDFDYNFGGLCAVIGTVYVLQNGCARTSDAFSNGNVAGSNTVSVSLSCGCTSSITYNMAQLQGNDGAFVANVPVFGTFYGNAGCSYPNFPSLPGMQPPIVVSPLTVPVTPDMCNGGPYFVVGIYDPLPAGCPQVNSGYSGFNMPCPDPVLTGADLCNSVTDFDLNTLEDPMVPNGVWSGPGVSGTTFNATGLTGPISLSFTPDGPCGTAATTTINVFEAPTAQFVPLPPACAGSNITLTVNLQGQAPWTFELFEGNVFINTYTFTASPAQITLPISGNTTFNLRNLSDALCTGADASLTLTTSPPPVGVISLNGPASICGGEQTSLRFTFSGAPGPYTFTYAANGVPQTPAITTSSNPYILTVTPAVSTTYTLSSLTAGVCTGTTSGSAVVTITSTVAAVLESDTTNICPGQTDTVTVTLSGSGPFTFVHSVDGVAQPPINTPGPTYPLIFAPSSGGDTIRLLSVTNGTCTGVVSGNYILNVAPPLASMSGDSTICDGDSTLILVNFAGIGPFTYSYSVNGSPLPAITTSNNPDTILVSPTINSVYKLLTLSTPACTGVVSADSVVVNISGALSGVISGGGQICTNGSGTNVFFDFSGPGPYTYVYSINNVLQPQVTTTQVRDTLAVNPNIGSIYRLVSVTNGICNGNVSGFAPVFVFTPPTANLFGDATFCNIANTNVTIDFTGTGPFTIQWSIDNVPQAIVNTFDDPYFIPVNTTTTTTYELLVVESPGCIGNPVGEATITVNYTPSYNNISLTCNGANTQYVVEFDVLNGTPPYTLNAGSGTFTGNHFTSNPIPITLNYNIVFEDASNCGAVTVSGVPNCNCTSESGMLNSLPQFVCVSNAATVPVAAGSVLDANDTIRYILQTNPGLPLGTILAWSATPFFTFQAGMQTGIPYYICAVAGDQQGQQVNLNDPCLSVSVGVPVTFEPLPTLALAVPDPEICLGDSTQVAVSFTGTAPYSFSYSLGGVVQTPPFSNINQANFTWNIAPTGPTTVELSTVSDQYCNNGTVSGSANITVNTSPQIGAFTSNCDFNSGTYTVQFEIVSGTAPFDIEGDFGLVTGTTFVSDPINFGDPYFFVLRDAFDCAGDTLSGMVQCLCTAEAGTMSTTPFELCIGEVATPTHSGAILEPGDVLGYILHTGNSNTLGTVLGSSPLLEFAFTPGLTLPGQTYYISAVVANDNGTGGPDLSDPCLDVAIGTPVVWYNPPTATISGNFEVCAGTQQIIQVQFTGQPPYNFTYTQNGQPVSTIALSNTFNISVNLQQSATFELVSVSDVHCAGTVSGQAVVTVHPEPLIQNVSTTCDPNTLTYVVEFDVAGATPGSVNISGTVPGTFNTGNGHFTSNPIPVKQAYQYTVEDVQFNCGSAQIADTVICACTTNAGTMQSATLSLCAGDTARVAPAAGAVLDGNDVLLYFLAEPGIPPVPIAFNTIPEFAFNPATMTYNAPYIIFAVAGDQQGAGIDPNDPCADLSAGAFVSWRLPVTATLSGSASICAGNTAALTLVFSGAGPFNYTYSDGVNTFNGTAASSPSTLSVSPGSSTTYTLTGVSGAGNCIGSAGGSASVQVTPIPTASLSGRDTVCRGENAAFQILLSGTPPFTLQYAINGTPQAPIVVPGFSFFIASNSIQQNQNFTLISVQSGNCPGTVSGSAAVVVRPDVSATITAENVVCAGDSASVSIDLQGITSADVVVSVNGIPFVLNAVQDGQVFRFVPPANPTTVSLISVMAAGNPCPATLGAPLSISISNPTLSAQLSDYGGYNLSCADATDGEISLQIQGGVAPVSVLWSVNNASGTSITGLRAGAYSATITDGVGCSLADTFTLTAPPAIQLQVAAETPDCFGQRDGALRIDSLSGGVGPYTVSINGNTAQIVGNLPFEISPLPPDNYTLAVEDANGCTAFANIPIDEPPALTLSIGNDTIIYYGDSLLLNPITNAQAATAVWSPVNGLLQPAQLQTWARPLESILYALTVVDSNGCQVSDQIQITVQRLRRVYIPNVLAPDAAAPNNIFTVYAGPEVSRVRYLRVYDRWGEQVHEAEQFLPGDTTVGWNGRVRGKAVNPGVFVYVIEVEYLNGETEVFSGDISVLR